MPRVRGRNQKSQSQEPVARAVSGEFIDPQAVTVTMIQALIPLGVRRGGRVDPRCGGAGQDAVRT